VTRFFESVTAGEATELTKGPLTTAHLMRWSGATENWHKIHYDQKFTLEHEKLPGLLINGSLKQQFLVEMLKAWAGAGGRVWKMSFQFRGMNIAGETLTAWARVKSTARESAWGLVELEIGIRNEKGVESTPGSATIALPYENGQPLPYPFKS
jgi:hydroxyacyl-ACP dehydratase HTD2-like protein with hotdog domain